jgi:type I restriction enzyme, S subunit
MEEQQAGWQRIKLGDAVTLQRGKDLPLRERFPGQFPVIGSSGIVGYHSHFVAKGPGVLVGRSGSAGSVTWIERDYWPLNTSLWVSDFHGNDARFIFYFLEFLDLGKFTAGVSVPTLNRNTVHPLAIQLPDVREQKAIAQTLDAVQNIKDALLRELSLERESKVALAEHLFTNGTRGEATKQTEIGEIPERWSVAKLGDACMFLQYGTSRRCDAGSSGAPVLGIPNVVKGRVVDKGLRFLEATDEERKKLELHSGDIVFVRTNANREYTGRCAVFRNEVPAALFASYLIRARLTTETLLPDFVREYTDTWRGKTYLSGRASNAADGKFNINTQTIRGVLVPLPQLEEQKEIASALRACDEKLDSLEKGIELLDELFKAILEELMTGRFSALPLIEEHQTQ